MVPSHSRVYGPESAGDRREGLCNKPCLLPETGGPAVSRQTGLSNGSSKGPSEGSPRCHRQKGLARNSSVARARCISFNDRATAEASGHQGHPVTVIVTAAGSETELSGPKSERRPCLQLTRGCERLRALSSGKTTTLKNSPFPSLNMKSFGGENRKYPPQNIRVFMQM